MADRQDSTALHDLVRGRLPEAEAAALQAAIEADPALKAEHRLIHALNETDAAPHPFPGEFGWAKLSRAIDREAPRRPWQRNVRVWQAAAGLVVAIFAWQLTVAPQLSERSGAGPGYVTATGETGAQSTAATLRVAFVPDATEAAIRALLREAGAGIVEGPTALGFYTLGFDSDATRDAAMERFAAAPAVIQFADPP